MIDLDTDLKTLFDNRLEGLVPPPRTRRTARRGRFVAAGLGTVAVVGSGLVLNVNAVAAANGTDCADFLTKVRVWAQVHASDLSLTDHSAAKAELSRLAAQSGCSVHDAAHDQTHGGGGPHH